VLHTQGQGRVVAGKSVSHHHNHSALQRTELRRVSGDTGMTEMDGAMCTNRDTGVMAMDRAMGSIYFGDPWVDSITSSTIYYHIIQRITQSIFPIFRSHLLYLIFRGPTQLCQLSWPSIIILSHPLPMLLEPEPFLLTNFCWNSMRGAAECWWWTLWRLAPPFSHTAFRGGNYCDMRSAQSWKWASMEHQQLLVLNLGWSKFRFVAIIHIRCNGIMFTQNGACHTCYPIVKMSVNGASSLLVLHIGYSTLCADTCGHNNSIDWPHRQKHNI